MQKLMVKDIMVPLEKYAIIHEDRLLIEAIEVLEKAQKAFEAVPYVHRAVLAYDDTKKIVGKLSQWDVIKCLEPKYESFGDIRSTSLSGLSPELIKSMMEKYGLWQVDLDDICSRVARKKVKDVMYKPTEGEKIEVFCPGSPYVEGGEGNLAAKAARYFFSQNRGPRRS